MSVFGHSSIRHQVRETGCGDYRVVPADHNHSCHCVAFSCCTDRTRRNHVGHSRSTWVLLISMARLFTGIEAFGIHSTTQAIWTFFSSHETTQKAQRKQNTIHEMSDSLCLLCLFVARKQHPLPGRRIPEWCDRIYLLGKSNNGTQLAFLPLIEVQISNN